MTGIDFKRAFEMLADQVAECGERIRFEEVSMRPALDVRESIRRHWWAKVDWHRQMGYSGGPHWREHTALADALTLALNRAEAEVVRARSHDTDTPLAA